MLRLPVALLLCLLLPGPLLASSTRLQLYTEHFPPYNFLHNNQIVGINTALVQRACQLAQLECRLSLYPWLRAFEMASSDPMGGIYTTALTPQRRAQFHWVGPLASSRSFLYRLKRRPDVAPANLAQAKNYGLAVAAGDVYEEFFLSQGFERGKNLLDFPTKSAPIALFLQGKVDLVVGSEQVMPSWLAAHGADMSQVEPVVEVNVPGNNYLALNKAVPAEIVEKLQQALQQMQQNGEYAAILNQVQPDWFSNSKSGR